MVVRQDWVMRMIDRLYWTFKQAVAGDDITKEERIAMMEEIMGEVLHTKPEWVSLQHPNTLEQMDDRLAVHLGLLLATYARLHPTDEVRGRAAALALAGLSRAAHLPIKGDERLAADVIRELLEEPEAYRLVITPQQVAEHSAALFEAYARHDRATDAEELLFATLSIHPEPGALIERARVWYHQLLERPDHELEALDLPRPEVRDGLEELDQWG